MQPFSTKKFLDSVSVLNCEFVPLDTLLKEKMKKMMTRMEERR